MEATDTTEICDVVSLTTRLSAQTVRPAKIRRSSQKVVALGVLTKLLKELGSEPIVSLRFFFVSAANEKRILPLSPVHARYAVFGL